MTNNELADLLEEAAQRLRRESTIVDSYNLDDRLCIRDTGVARVLDCGVRTVHRLPLEKVRLADRTIRFTVRSVQKYLDSRVQEP